MSLINILKTNLKDFIQVLSVSFPKSPIHTEEERKERIRGIVSYVGGLFDGNSYFFRGKYITSEDIEKRKEELRGYNFMKN